VNGEDKKSVHNYPHTYSETGHVAAQNYWKGERHLPRRRCKYVLEAAAKSFCSISKHTLYCL